MKKNHKFHFRYITVAAFFALVCLLFAARIVYLQISSPELKKDSGLSVKTVTIKAMRGEIYDRNGKKLVSNEYSYNICLDAGSFPKSNNAINSTVTKLSKLVPEKEYNYFPLENEYPSYSYKEFDKDSSEYKSFQKMLDRFSLKRDTGVKEFTDFLFKRYGLLDKENKLTVDKDELNALLRIRYEMDRLEFSPLNPFTVTENADMQTITSVKEANLDGVVTEKIAKRIYNYPGYMSHILGRTGKIPAAELEAYTQKGYAMDAIVGIEGAEKAFEDYLRGTDGTLITVEDKNGNIVDEYYKKQPVPGKDVYLTIDVELQICAEDALAYNIAYIKEKADKKIEEKINKYTDANGNLRPNANIPQYIGEDVNSGAATLVNPNNGEVYALASYPTYDLTTYLKEYNNLLNAPHNPLYNRALMGAYEPGSTFKIGVAAAALEYGIINKDTIIYDSGIYKYYEDFRPQCWIYSSYGYGHGKMNVISAIQHSCNYFFYETGRLLTIENMNAYTKKLGLGEFTGIELPESKGILAGPAYSSSINKLWVPGDTVQAAIGQSDNTFTPLQISTYLSTIVNGGTRYQAHILHSVRDFGTNEIVYRQDPNVLNEVQLSEDNLNTLKIGMRNVMENGTAAPVFSNYPIDIGGKTGTAQVGKTKSNNGIFMAFAPYDNPEVVASCVIEQAGGSNDVGVTLRRMFNKYFNITE
ncbi:MAG: hypothetical protein IJ292_04040 [Clostridia bacterium]|nr:hypothetical protein [Clostridia bacterium]